MTLRYQNWSTGLVFSFTFSMIDKLFVKMVGKAKIQIMHIMKCTSSMRITMQEFSRKHTVRYLKEMLDKK